MELADISTIAIIIVLLSGVRWLGRFLDRWTKIIRKLIDQSRANDDKKVVARKKK